MTLHVFTTRLIRGPSRGKHDGVADLVLPVFAIIVTGWLAGWLGYVSRSLADGLVHFAYNVAMPALRHRITLAPELQIEVQRIDQVLDALLVKVPAPRQ